MFTGFLNRFRKNTLWNLQFLLTAMAAAWLGSLAIVSISQKVYPNGITWFNELRCAAGMATKESGAECIQTTIIKTLEEQNKYKKLNEELTAKLQSIADIEGRWNDIHLFSTKVYQNNSDVISGVKYPSLLSGNKWSNAWCYWRPETTTVDFKISLGTVKYGNEIKWRTIPNKELEAANVSRSDIEATKVLCRWPERV